MPLLRTTKPGRFWHSLPSPYVIHAPMLGLPCIPFPLCIKKCAVVCSEKSPYMDRIIARSSTHSPTWGNRSLTGIPLCPYFLNSQGDLSTLPTFSNWVGGTFIL